MKQILKIDKMYKLFGKSEHICKECKHLRKNRHGRTYGEKISDVERDGGAK